MKACVTASVVMLLIGIAPDHRPSHKMERRQVFDIWPFDAADMIFVIFLILCDV